MTIPVLIKNYNNCVKISKTTQKATYLPGFWDKIGNTDPFFNQSDCKISRILYAHLFSRFVNFRPIAFYSLPAKIAQKNIETLQIGLFTNFCYNSS